MSVRKVLPCFCKNGMIGYKQFYLKLVEIHFDRVIVESVVKHHYKYLVWKLSSCRHLSIESLYFHIEHRIYLTTHTSFKPFLQKYLTRLKQRQEDITTGKGKKKISTQLNQVILYIGEIIETQDSYLVEFTDTWTSAYKIVYKCRN